ncbi:ribokinase [Mycoplasmatota bacterium]|nr:ribokinase [Mycoplasmatota bacterium]
MKKVFVLGSINMDFLFTIDHLPKKGQTLTGKEFSSLPGGKGANQAVAAAKQGVETYMIGNVGDDALGDELIDKLKSYQVKCDYIKRIKDTSSGLACILLENNDNRIIVNPGANNIHDIEYIKKVLEENANEGDIFLTQLEIPLDIVKKSIKIAKSIGMMSVLNAAPMKDLDQETLSNVDLLCVNESETKALINLQVDDTNIDQAFSKIEKLGPKTSIITLGEKGSYYKDKDELIYTKVYLSQIVDTTGAGDAFTGIYLAYKILGEDTALALKKATAGASMTIETMGAQNAIPNKEMIDSFLEREENK